MKDLDLKHNDAYLAGFDCGQNGPNSATNCQIRHFATRESTKAWEQGKKDGETELERQLSGVVRHKSRAKRTA